MSMTFQSCSSIFYSSELRKENNSFEVNSNMTDYKITYKKISDSTPQRIKSNLFSIDKLSEKKTFLTVKSPGCQDIEIILKRTPRTGAILLDIPLSVFYGLPLLIDVFRADFYKISTKSKSLNIQFLRTDKYFEEQINRAVKLSNIDILDSIAKESPSKENVLLIDKTRKQIYKANLNKEINRLLNPTLESFIYLNSKYSIPPLEGRIILDSLKYAIEQREIYNIKQNSNLLRLIALKKIADASFLIILDSVKPEIEQLVYNDLIKNYNFEKLSSLNKAEDEISQKKLASLKVEIEKKLINEISKNNNIELLDAKYNQVSNNTKVKLDSLKPIITEYNSLQKLKQEINEINSLVVTESFEESFKAINKIYPNSFPENSPENKILKTLLIKTNNGLKEMYIVKCIDYINTETNQGRYPLREIEALLNNNPIIYSNNSTFNIEIKENDITSIQRNQLTKLKIVLTKNREIDIKNEQLKRNEEQKRVKFEYSKTCSWCNKSFTGEHYTHLGKLADCYSTSNTNTLNKFCSMRCCSESRRRGSGY